MHADGLAHAGVAPAHAAEGAAAVDEHAVAQHDVGRAADDRGVGGAVVAAIHAGVDRGQRLGRDVDRDATGAGHAVVGRVRATQCQPGDGHRQVAAHVLVGQRARGQAGGRCGDGHHVAGDQVGGIGGDGAAGADVHRHEGGAVVGAVNRAHTGQADDAQRAGRDAGGGAGAGGAQAVVASVGAGQRDARDGDGLAGADVLGAKPGEAGGFLQRNHVSGDGAVEDACDRCRRGAIVNTRAARVGHGDRLGRDVGAGGAGGAAQPVVGGVQAAQLARGHIDVLGQTRVLARREHAAAADGDRVAGHHVAGAAQHAGHCGAVVDLVHAGVRGSQQLLRDVDRDAVGGRHAVVPGVGASQRQTVHHQGLVVAGPLVDQRARGQARDRGQHAHHVAGHDVSGVDGDGAAAADRDADRACAVVHPVGRGHARQPCQGNGLGRDGAGGAGVAGGQAVVVGVAALQADTADLDGLARAGILGAGPGEHRGAVQRDAVAHHEVAHRAGHRRAGGSVIGPAAAGVGGGDLAAGDVGRGAARGVEQHVVASVGARQAGAGNGQRLGAALVLGTRPGEVAVAADEQAVAGDQVGGRAGDGGRGGAVVHAIDAAVAGGQRLGRDVDGDARGARNAVVAGIGAGQREPVHTDRLGCARILVEHGAGGDPGHRHVDGDGVAGNDVAAVGHQGHAHGHGDSDLRAAVVHAVHRGHIAQAADGDGFACDAAGGAARGGGQGVVGCIGAGQRHAAHADGFARAHVARACAGEFGALRGGDDVARHPVEQRRSHRGDDATVVDLGSAREVGRQCARCDVGRGAAVGVEQAVVVSRSTGQESTCDADRLVAAHVLARSEQALGREADQAGVHRQDVARGGRDLPVGTAVIDLVQAGVHRRQGLRCDVDRQAGGADERVVAGRRAIDRQTGDRHWLVVAHVAIGQRAGADAAGWQGDADHITCNHGTGVHGGTRHVDRHAGGAVIDPVGGRDAGHAQWPWRDAGRGAGGVGQQAVVGGLGAREGDVADGHRLVVAHRAIAREQGGLRHANLVTRHKLQGTAHHRSGEVKQTVVDTAGAGVGEVDRFGRDVCGGAGGGAGQRVVGRAGAGQHDVGHADGLGRSHVLGVDAGEHRLLAEGHRVASGDAGGGGCDGGADTAVVDPVDTGVGGRQCGLRDVDSDATARGVDAVVASVTAGQGQAGDGDRLVAAHVLVGNGARAQAPRRQGNGHRVAGDEAAGRNGACVDGHRGGAVVGPVHGGDAADRDGLRRDGAGGRGGGVANRVVASVRARQADAADADRLARADVLGVGTGVVGSLRRRNGVTGVQARSAEIQGDVGRGAAVIDLGTPVEGQVHRLGCDAGGGGDAGVASAQTWVDQAVVGGVGAGQLVIGDGDRLAGSHVPVVAVAKAGPWVVAVVAGDVVVAVDADCIAGDEVTGGGRGAHGGATVVDLVGSGIAGGHVLLRDVDGDPATRATGDAVVARVGAGQGQARYRHGFGIAHILVGHLADDAATARRGHADHIASHHGTGIHRGAIDGDLHVARGVIDPVDGAHAADRQGFGRDDPGRGGRGVLQGVVGGVGAADADA